MADVVEEVDAICCNLAPAAGLELELPPFSATVAVLGDNRRFRRQSPVWTGLKVHLACTLETQRTCREPGSTIATCRDSAILSETGFSTRKSRELVADISEPVRNQSASTY